MSKKILLSGIQPSGRPHLGNYFGMMKQIVDSQDKYEIYCLIVDYHALNTVQNSTLMKEFTVGVLLDFLAIGLDPEKVTLVKQSDIYEHMELAWIFETITPMAYLMRSHAFKDAEAKNKTISVGVFNYPLLMAADILLYDTDVVPVGSDQIQHIEIARDVAEKFNGTFGSIFKKPEAMIMNDVAIVPGIDGRKMSKSYSNTIPLFSEYEDIKKLVMSIVTDSGDDIPRNVFAIHKLIRSSLELEKIYIEKKGKYKELKELLIVDLENFIAPLREKRKEFEKDIPKALAVLKEGSKKARNVASKKMEEVRKKIGVDIYQNNPGKI